MTEFESVRIGDLGKVVTGKTPKTEEAENFGNDYMFIGPTDLHKHFFIKQSEKMISCKGLASIKGSGLNGLSILVGCIGWDMGNVGIVEGRCATNQQINSITNINSKYNPLYIYYWLKTRKAFLFKLAGLTRTPILNKTDFSEIRINLPKEKSIQDKTADLLVALDAKIDLNNRINAELEALAKTIYDYWFVQFDFPDAHGRPYKSSGGAMVWNDTLKREIPAGWEAVPLSRLVEEIKDGITPNAFDTATPYIGLEHIARKSIVLSAWATADKATSNKITFRKGDILFGKIRPYFHKVALAMMEGIASTDAIVMRPRQRGLAAFALETIFSDRFVETATASSTGSKMPRADWKVMRNYGVAIPGKSSSVADGYQKLFDGIASKIENNVRQNLELTQIRDWLLPLLMNGQVRVA